MNGPRANFLVRLHRTNMSCATKSAAYFLTFILLAFSIACGGLGFAYEKKLSGKYCLQATDTLEQMSISEMPSDGGNVYTAVIPATVFAVGWDEHFIIAKQHPLGDKTAVNFYILRVADGLVSGPWAEPAFNAERKKLLSIRMPGKPVFESL